MDLEKYIDFSAILNMTEVSLQHVYRILTFHLIAVKDAMLLGRAVAIRYVFHVAD